MSKRENIRLDMEALERKVQKHAKKKSTRSQAISKQYQRVRDGLIGGDDGFWHRPEVSPFHTITGRDQVLGHSLVQLSKNAWSDIISPPTGSVYALLDYEQQEPMIAASLSGCQSLMGMYERGDIYTQLAADITNAEVSRDVFKELLLSHINGTGVRSAAEKLNLPEVVVRRWLIELKRKLQPIDSYLTHQVFLAKRRGLLQSLDWRHFISPDQNNKSIRNWPLQATGADIMRRACFNLDESNIPLLLTNHDSFLVRLDEENQDSQLELAVKALKYASTEVLHGFSLKTKVEMLLPSKPKRCTK
ncbi:DNA polymerase [Vibrio diabolicus]|uniref:DNA polymerase n=1 Tax=Vibrio diabolicus TaxID=50719 RepID=UPI0035A866FA